MSAKSGVCPICTNFFEGLHCHHIVPREMTLNGKRGNDWPTVFICSSCHDMAHRQVKSDIAQTGKNYFTPEQYIRATTLLKILTVATISNSGTDSGQLQKIVLQFTREQMTKLHAAKIDHGATNLAKFLEAVIKQSINGG